MKSCLSAVTSSINIYARSIDKLFNYFDRTFIDSNMKSSFSKNSGKMADN